MKPLERIMTDLLERVEDDELVSYCYEAKDDLIDNAPDGIPNFIGLLLFEITSRFENLRDKVRHP